MLRSLVKDCYFLSINWSIAGKDYTFVYYWTKIHQSTPVLCDQKERLIQVSHKCPFVKTLAHYKWNKIVVEIVAVCDGL